MKQDESEHVADKLEKGAPGPDASSAGTPARGGLLTGLFEFLSREKWWFLGPILGVLIVVIVLMLTSKNGPSALVYSLFG